MVLDNLGMLNHASNASVVKHVSTAYSAVNDRFNVSSSQGVIELSTMKTPQLILQMWLKLMDVNLHM